jgi:predicted amidohydrolase
MRQFVNWEDRMSEECRLNLAMAQILVEGGKLPENLARATQAIALAAQRNCQVVVLPECLDVGWTHPSARQSAAEIPGPTSNVLCRAAAAAGVYVVAGLTERAGSRIYNAAVLIDPDGKVRLKHRKINLLDIEQESYSIGDRLRVVETACGTVGVNICADNFPDSLALGHALARMGAQMILSPSAWAVPADHDPAVEPYGALWEGAYTQLARLYEMPIVGVSNVGPITAGPWAGRKCIGCSLAVGPGGEILAKGPYGSEAEQLIIVEIPLKPRTVTGTDIAPMLRGKGYDGP